MTLSDATPHGLSSAEAAVRLDRYGPNVVRQRRPLTQADLLIRQLMRPLLLILVFAATADRARGRADGEDESAAVSQPARRDPPVVDCGADSRDAAIPYLPFAGLVGFVPLPGTLVVTVCAITAAYALAVELVMPRYDPSMAIT